MPNIHFGFHYRKEFIQASDFILQTYCQNKAVVNQHLTLSLDMSY